MNVQRPTCRTKKWLEMNVVKWYKVHQMLLEVLGNILKNYSFFKISLYELVADLG